MSERQEVYVQGARVEWMKQFLEDNGATFIRAESDTGKYYFIDNDEFKLAFAQLQKELCKGLF